MPDRAPPHYTKTSIALYEVARPRIIEGTMSTASPRLTGSDATSLRLLAGIRQGDRHALDQFFARYAPRLHRWTRRRFPRWIRVDADTPDIVHDVLLRSLGRLRELQPRSRDALQRYFRTAVANRIRDEHRRFPRRAAEPLPPAHDAIDRRRSSLDRLLDHERQAKYRSALARLDSHDRDLIVGHVELGYSYAQLGCMTDRSPNAARMALHRAVGRLAVRMNEG
jgi:RNA polymerase sigma-70 factor (ECF subfamily)